MNESTQGKAIARFLSEKKTSMQLGLFAADGTESSGVAEIQWIPTDKLIPHPDNPRLIYRDDIIETIAQSIAENGFKPEYALLVRPHGDDYQIISGHTRHKAALSAECKLIPCWVKEMGDLAAYDELRLANKQGELSFRDRARHVFGRITPRQGVADQGLSEYAKKQGIDQAQASREYACGKVDSYLHDTCHEVWEMLNEAEKNGASYGRHESVFNKTDPRYWAQLGKLLVEKEWSVKQTEAIVNAIKGVDIPKILHEFLDPEFWIKKVIADATSDNPQGYEKKVMLWVNSAMNYLEGENALSVSGNQWKFDENGRPFLSHVDLQDLFLSKLPDLCNGDKVPSQKRIDALAQKLTDDIKQSKLRYEQWEKAQASKDEAERQKREEIERINALRVKYAPTGINADLLTVTLADLGNEQFDAIITDPPYLLSDGGTTVRSGKEVSVNKNFDDSEDNAPTPKEWLTHCIDWLKPGGYLVATCTDHLLFDLYQAAKELGLIHLQNLIWHKENAPPLLTADRFVQNYEYVFVAYKPGTRYYGYDLVKLPNDKQRGAVINIPQCGGSERLGWHDTQKPLELMELLINAYVPTDGRLLDPFAGSGTTPVAAKKLSRISYWVEKKTDFFEKAEYRIESEPFNLENLEF